MVFLNNEIIEAIYRCRWQAVALLAATIFASRCVSFYIRRLSILKVPGPWYTTLTGLVLVYHEYHGHRRTYVHALHQRYGRVVRLGPNEVSFTSAGAAKSIYGTGSAFEKPPLFDLFLQRGTRNTFTQRSKKEHSHAKRRYADRYSNSAILSSANLDAIKERARAFLAQVISRSECEIYRPLHAFALDCVSHTLFAPYGTRSLDEDTHDSMIETLSYYDSRKDLVLRHSFPTIHRLLSGLSRSSTKASAQVQEYIASKTLQRADVAPFTVAAKLQQSDVSPLQVYSECADHLFAGVETTGDTLCFLLWQLSQPESRDIQAQLRRELQSASITSEIGKLPFLNAVIDEGLRLYTAAANHLSRIAPRSGAVVDGYVIPGEALVSVQPYTAHRSDEYSHAEEFDPSRWLDGTESTAFQGPSSYMSGHRVSDQALYMPFGIGTRTCVGKNLARAEMAHLLATVYSQFSTVPSERMVVGAISMEMSDQLLTVRPRDMACWLKFVAIQ